jgi:hypothetical protein
MAFSKFFRKSFFEPKKLGFAKLSKEKYSERSFYGKLSHFSKCMRPTLSRTDTWMGVPDRITRRLTSREFRAWNVSDSDCVET